MTERREIADWDVPAPPPLGAPQWGWAALVGAVPVAAAAALGSAVAGGLGALAAAGIVVAAEWLWWIYAPRRALAAMGARPLGAGEEERFEHLVAGLAGDLRTGAPALYVWDGEGANALVARSRGPVIAVSRGLLTGTPRTELEAVAAHCLVRLADPGSLLRARLVHTLGPLAGPLRPAVTRREDVRAAALTHYPPALAAALDKADVIPGAIGALGFAGAPPWHRDTAERAAEIRDL